MNFLQHKSYETGPQRTVDDPPQQQLTNDQPTDEDNNSVVEKSFIDLEVINQVKE